VAEWDNRRLSPKESNDRIADPRSRQPAGKMSSRLHAFPQNENQRRPKAAFFP